MRSRTRRIPVIVLAVFTAELWTQTRAAGDQVAQTAGASTQPPAFEVASIKLNKSGSLRSNFDVTAGRFTATNVNVLQLISISYSNAGPLPSGAISGAASWLRTDHFDIVAKAEGNASPEDIRAMIRTLLADRFSLRMRRESTSRPIYALTMARESTTGPQARRTDAVCPSDPGANNADHPRQPAANPSLETCQLRIFPGKLTGRGITMEQLAKSLVSTVDDHREIRNRTGLEGRFDIELTWMPSNVGALPLRDQNAPPLPAIDPNAPSLFTALKEQLGLKLESEKDYVEVLVIEHIEHPTLD